jgi:hypothetical protein
MADAQSTRAELTTRLAETVEQLRALTLRVNGLAVALEELNEYEIEDVRADVRRLELELFHELDGAKRMAEQAANGPLGFARGKLRW